MQFIAGVLFVLLIVVLITLGYTYAWCDRRPCNEYCVEHVVWSSIMKKKCRKRQQSQVTLNEVC